MMVAGNSQVPVLIVGANPVGLVLACELVPRAGAQALTVST
jgi:2-polyprenyl-6-methoxyphenol hydroxylase-like FAD-dependent oxidoreductase